MTSPHGVRAGTPGHDGDVTTSSSAAVDLTVDEAMVTQPKTWPASTTVAAAAAAFSDHVHLLLLVEGDRLVGTLTREDLSAAAPAHAPAIALARLAGRTVRSGTPLQAARDRLEQLGVRRVAVVDADDRLQGLLCLKRHRGGYCSDAGVAARAAARD